MMVTGYSGSNMSHEQVYEKKRLIPFRHVYKLVLTLCQLEI